MGKTVFDRAISTFLCNIRSSWSQVRGLASQVPKIDVDEFLADWAQASWEMLVEAAVSAERGEPVYLAFYGEGADCNGWSCRVWCPDALPTHAVHVVPASGTELLDVLSGHSIRWPAQGFELDRFVSLSEDGWYREAPPFDHVLVYEDEVDLVVALDEVAFLLVEVRGET